MALSRPTDLPCSGAPPTMLAEGEETWHAVRAPALHLRDVCLTFHRSKLVKVPCLSSAGQDANVPTERHPKRGSSSIVNIFVLISVSKRNFLSFYYFKNESG